MVGRKISIFLVDGTASGMRTAELGLSTIKALVVPRASLAAASGRPDTQKRTGIYVLVGQDEEVPNQKRIYIGESDSIIARIGTHDKDPKLDFWDEAVMLVSKDDNLTKAHSRYVEARLLKLAREAKRAAIANVNAPPEQGKLPEADAIEMDEFISQARLLLGTLGHDVFEPLEPPSILSQPPQSTAEQLSQVSQAKFRFSGPNFDATMVVDEIAGQFIVKAGSTAKRSEVPALPMTYKNLRMQLVAKEVLRPVNDLSFEFAQDWPFTAPSPAAQVVSGTTVSGRAVWKLEGDGKTLAEWMDAKLPDQ